MAILPFSPEKGLGRATKNAKCVAVVCDCVTCNVCIVS